MIQAIKDAFEALVDAAPEEFQNKLISLVEKFYNSGGRRPGEIDSFGPLLAVDPSEPFPIDEETANRAMCSAAALLEIARAGGPSSTGPPIPELWPNLTKEVHPFCRKILRSPLPKHLSHEGLRDFMAAKGYVCQLIDAFVWLDGDHHIPIIGRNWRPPSKSYLLDGPTGDD
jgi:hypothetical protein